VTAVTWLMNVAEAAEGAVGETPPKTGLEWLWGKLTWDRVESVLLALLILALGAVVIKLLARAAGKSIAKKWGGERGGMVRKVVSYGGWVLLLLMVLNQLGVQITALLAAAGIAGIAIGFAAQTSLSNIISGIFLSVERPFKAGDMVQVGDTLGVVLSVDLLSVKMRMFDNRFVRIPNENLIKAQVINFSRYPIRRVDLMIGVAYKEDIDRVRDVLFKVAHAHPLALEEPEPLCFCWNYNSSSVDLLFVVWAVQDDWLKLKDELLRNIKRRFDEDDIEIPFPHVSLYSGEAMKPLPVSLSPETLQQLNASAKGKKS
jgi:small-conductance mechanosensitive channel